MTEKVRELLSYINNESGNKFPCFDCMNLCVYSLDIDFDDDENITGLNIKSSCPHELLKDLFFLKYLSFRFLLRFYHPMS